MSKKHLFLIISLFCLALSSQAQETDSTEYDDDEEPVIAIPPINEKMKLGVKLGGGLYMMGGGEANQPYPLFGLNGGLYFRYRFATHWSIQPEADASFRGGKFDNGVGKYQTIRTYFLDVPLLLMYGLNEKNTTNIFIGPQYSYLLNSAIYVQGSDIADAHEPQLAKHDLMLVAGAQFYTPFVGFQLALKYGFLNANKGLVPSLPPVSSGKDLHHMSFEFGFIF